MAAATTTTSPVHWVERAAEAATASGPVDVTGARDETEGAMVSLLTALESLGLITDSTTAS